MKSFTESGCVNLTQCVTDLMLKMQNFNLVNYKLLNLIIFSVVVISNLIKWTVFGKLSDNEISNLRDKISYTIWEFWFGFFIFLKEIRHKEGIQSLNLIIQNEFLKYSGLFLCIMLLKSFHFLTSDRLHSLDVKFDPKDKQKMSQFKKLGFGILILHCIDILLAVSFIYQVYFIYNQSQFLNFDDNILISIFGFEIFHIYPLLVFTCSKFFTMYYNIKKPHVNFTKLLNFVEICTNLVRFIMMSMFAVLFLYYYTFPIHILPSSYLSLRVLIVKIRCLISLERRNLKYKKDISIEPDSECVICLEHLNYSNSDGIKCLDSCDHTFHYKCLKRWMNHSQTCPVCRIKIGNSVNSVITK
ncbi:hypothetical protein CLIB1444_01S19988 [[Candida] jaroonii]|uniref:Uncharacterized protein n=1 Tax=[Candida] jaroonii TaxID=467808 RepID=A0ACA9Y2A9_9ASCO|nr:hypothetical protein CLIB1444_01S19988 [[Candida] jaroonii]